MGNNQPIGIFDSGIGGLTVAAAIQHKIPNEEICYVGDSDRCPYGNKKPEQVIQYACEICDFLVGKNVKMLVVACNTATAVALPTLTDRYNIPVVGVIQPGAKAAIKSQGKQIGVIGTEVTIASGAYESEIHLYDENVEVWSQSCPAFVPLVEQGRFEGIEVEQIVQASLQELMKHSIDTLILGCTHYPLLQNVIQRVVGFDVNIISSASATAERVHQFLAEHGALADRKLTRSIQQYFTTGDVSQMRKALREWFFFPENEWMVDSILLSSLGS